MSKNLPVELSIKSKPLNSELASIQGSLQKKGLHQNSLSYEIHQKMYIPQWEWFIKDQYINLKRVNRIPTRDCKEAKWTQKVQIYCLFEGISYLSDFLKRFTSLRHLRLNIRSSGSLRAATAGLPLLINALNNNKLYLLESFELFFCNCHWTSDEKLKSLAESLRANNSLKTFTLSFFYKSKFTDLGISYLCQNLKHLISLQSISFEFFDCPFTNRGLNTLKEFLNSLKNLQTAKLYFRCCHNISLYAVEDLIQGFENSTMIIGYVTWKIIIKDLPQESNGRFIGFHMDFWPYGRRAEFESIKKVLARRAALGKNVSFELEHPLSTYQYGLRQVSRALKALSFLQNFSFKYEVNDDKALNKISHSIGYLKNLKNLTIEFIQPFYYQKKILGQLSKSLGKLNLLENLEVKFSRCYSIADEDLEFLGQGLEKLVNLQHANFYFSESFKISDLGFEILVQSLENLELLREITLRFVWGYEKILSPEKERRINEILKNHQSLRKATLEFGAQKIEIINSEVQEKKGKSRQKEPKSGFLGVLSKIVIYYLDKIGFKRKKRNLEDHLILKE